MSSETLTNAARSESRPATIVIGAGALGLTTGFELARRGARVTLVDAGAPGRGALWASGGMLAPGFELSVETSGDVRAPGLAAFRDLALEAAALWPEFAARLEAETAAEIGFAQTGSLTPAFREREIPRLEAARRRAADFGLAAEMLDAAELARLEPGLRPALESLRFPRDGQVDARRLGPALVRALERVGARVLADTPAVRLEQTGAGWRVWLGGDRRLEADAVVLASGAAARIAGAPPLAGVQPVHGQMIAFDPAVSARTGLKSVLRGFSIYACIKADGRLIAGATSEPGRADTGVDVSARNRLLAAAREALPALAGAEPVEHWSGLRPAAADRLPVLGEAEPGLVLALGAYRNGVLTAPAAAVRLADFLLEGRTVCAALSPDRLG
jgi:glycine oxidase